jgi:hypothetical protein
MDRQSIVVSLLALLGSFLLVSATASAVTINFGYLPGPDGQVGTADDVPYSSSDITSYGGSRTIDNEYATAGVNFTGGPRLGIVGGTLDPDNVFGPGTNTLLNGTPVGGGVAPFSVLFDLPQLQITVDIYAYINSSGTSLPLTYRLLGLTVASETIMDTTPRIQDRYTLNPGVPFDQVDFALTGPSNGGIGIDNLTYVPEPAAAAACLLVGMASLLRRRVGH